MEEVTNKKYGYFLGVYLSFMVFLLFSGLNFNEGMAVAKISILFLLALYLFRSVKAQALDFEKCVIMAFTVFYFVLMLQRGKLQGAYGFLHILYGAALMMLAAVYFVRNYHRVPVKKWMIENSAILLVLAVFILLSVEVLHTWIMWDARQYYADPDGSMDIQGIVDNFDADFSGIYQLYLLGHASLGYSLWVIFFQLIREGPASVHTAGIILACISIYSFYQILRKILGCKYSNRMLALAALPYAVSPFVLGIVENVNVDHATMYFAVIFIACSLYHYEALELIFAFCLCFTKEPAVIYYAVYIVAKIICEYLKDNAFSVRRLMVFGFGNIKNYVYAAPVILWVVLYAFNSNSMWGSSKADLASWRGQGINTFGIASNVILAKLKQIFLLNFNWLFWVIILLVIIIFIAGRVKADKEILMMIIPICAFGAAVLVFGCFYITWVHVRYVVPVIPVIYLLAAAALTKLDLRGIRFWICNLMLAVLLLVQSYYVIDPVTKGVYPSISVGNGKIYSMQVNDGPRIADDKQFHDSIVYNRQYIYWPEMLVQALAEAEYDENMLIVWPDGPDCLVYSVFGSWSLTLWDKKEKRLDYYDESRGISDECVALKACNVSNMEEYLEDEKVLYLVPGWAEADQGFLSDERVKKQIIKRGKVDHKGFQLQYMVMDLEYHLPLDDGYYHISPKLDGQAELSADKKGLLLEKDDRPVLLSAVKGRYELVFEKYKAALDVPSNYVDEDGSVGIWERNHTEAQKWIIEKTDQGYMICNKGYALTYDLAENSIWLSEKTGAENQLWTFSNVEK